MSRGKAPERAGEVLEFVGSGSLGRVDVVETARAPSDFRTRAVKRLQLMNHDEGSHENHYAADES